MGYSREVIRAVRESYAGKWEKAAAAADARKEEIHRLIPRTEAIDRELSTTARSVMAAAVSGPGWEDKFARLRERNQALQAEKAALLTAAGFPADYTEIRYECEACKDTGYVGQAMCTCMKRAMAFLEYKESGLGHLMASQNFRNFDLSFYTGEDARRMTANRDCLLRFAETFDGKSGLSFLLLGGTGLGKTHLSTAVARMVIDRGFGVVYLPVQELMALYEKNRFGGAEEKVRDVLDADLLIIDDLGTELPGAFSVSSVYHVINSRLCSGRSTIISSNLTKEELRERYADRITSRLFGEYRPLLFTGRDIRAQKLARPG